MLAVIWLNSGDHSLPDSARVVLWLQRAVHQWTPTEFNWVTGFVTDPCLLLSWPGISEVILTPSQRIRLFPAFGEESEIDQQLAQWQWGRVWFSLWTTLWSWQWVCAHSLRDCIAHLWAVIAGICSWGNLGDLQLFLMRIKSWCSDPLWAKINSSAG